MNESNCFIFRYSNFKRKSGVDIFKIPQGDDEWNSKWKKYTEGENSKTYLLKNITLNVNL